MKGFAIGQRAQITRIFTPEDVAEYRILTGDSRLRFGSEALSREVQTVPGPLIGGMFSFLLGTCLPGRGTNWLKQRLRFLRPAELGQPLTASVEITRLRSEKELANLRTICTDPTGEVICEGEALVLVKDVEVHNSL